MMISNCFRRPNVVSGLARAAFFTRLSLISSAACIGFAFPDIVHGQTVIGSSMAEGKTIELLSDKTWRYKSQATAGENCIMLPLGLQFCGTETWTRMTPPTDEIASHYFVDDRNFGQFIAESPGLDDRINVNFMKKAATINAAHGANVRETDVAILDVRPAEVDGRQAETIGCQLDFKGENSVLITTIVFTPRTTSQVQTFGFSTQETLRMTELHQEFVDFARIE